MKILGGAVPSCNIGLCAITNKMKRRHPEVREREAQAKALKSQCPEVRKREAHAKKQSRIKQRSSNIAKHLRTSLHPPLVGPSSGFARHVTML